MVVKIVRHGVKGRVIDAPGTRDTGIRKSVVVFVW